MGGDAINDYSRQERGTFQNEDYAKQIVSFKGMIFEGRTGRYNITPTDIDGVIQLDKEDCAILFELKHQGGAACGQKTACEWIVDRIRMAGSNGIFLIAEHNTKYPETIIAKDAIVTNVYWNGKWLKPQNPVTLGDAVTRHIKWLHERTKRNAVQKGHTSVGGH